MMNTQQSNTRNIGNEDDLSLWDIVEFFQNHWKWLIVSAGMGLLAGLTYALTAQEKFEASASVQISSVANSPVETPQALVEKLKLPNYYSASTYASCGMQDRSEKGMLLVAALKAAVNPYTPIVEIKFRGNTPKQAQGCLESVFKDIEAAQAKLAKPTLELKKNELKFFEKELNHALEFSASAKNNIPKSVLDSKFSASVFNLALASKKHDEIVNLTKQITDTKVSLEEPKTSETKLVASIYSSEVKVAPKRGFITIAAMFAGFFIGLIVLLLKNTWVQQTKIWKTRYGKTEAK